MPRRHLSPAFLLTGAAALAEALAAAAAATPSFETATAPTAFLPPEASATHASGHSSATLVSDTGDADASEIASFSGGDGPAQSSSRRTFRGELTCRRCSWDAGQILVHHATLAGSAYAVLNRFWIVGDEAIADSVIVDYFVDGELFPSVSYEVSMASGQGFPRRSEGDDNSNNNNTKNSTRSSLNFFDLPEKMGHLAVAGRHSWFNAHKVPFQKNIVVQVRTLDPGLTFEVGADGYEVEEGSPTAGGIAFRSGFVLPPQARLQLQKIENTVYDPLNFATVAEVPLGSVGLLYLTTTVIDTSPSQNDYIEGCWHLYTDAEQDFPGVVLGTGVEDYFDSAYWFCALNGQAPCLFSHASSGLLHFSRTWANGSAISPEAQRKWRPQPAGSHERLSAYRFFDNEVVGFGNGGSLQWRVGETEDKCGGKSAAPLGHISSVTLRSYAWLYTWSLEDE